MNFASEWLIKDERRDRGSGDEAEERLQHAARTYHVSADVKYTHGEKTFVMDKERGNVQLGFYLVSLTMTFGPSKPGRETIPCTLFKGQKFTWVDARYASR